MSAYSRKRTFEHLATSIEAIPLVSVREVVESFESLVIFCRIPVRFPKGGAGQGLQALGPLSDGSHLSGNDPLLIALGDKCWVKQLNFPDGLLDCYDSGWGHPVAEDRA
jgi:hypothetical protein